MKPANQRVASYLDAFDMTFQIRLLSKAVRTAQLAADALGCDLVPWRWRHVETTDGVHASDAGVEELIVRMTVLTSASLAPGSSSPWYTR